MAFPSLSGRIHPIKQEGVGTCLVAGLHEDNIREAFNMPENRVPLYVRPLGYLKKQAGCPGRSKREGF